MLSKKPNKINNALKAKKYRIQDGFFIAEGLKTVNELLASSLHLHLIFTTKSFNNYAEKEIIISEAELKKISSLKTPNTVLAIFEIPEAKPINNEGLIVALDAIRDPGNLGTIIRLCDWFGVKELVCSNETVDCYNAKVVQASMGSITRVNISYVPLDNFIATAEAPLYGAFMDGDTVYKTDLPKNGILVMGNEANGISKTIEAEINKRISIPRFGNLQATESLNVATATAILLSEFRRNS